ncbi:hypothetical protein TNCV_2765271 [Trichonephila clavipes]|nr:hypothetical protein TNCV_2765271 [Trichonephila clavipes]
MNSSRWRGSDVIKREWFLIAAGENKLPLLRVTGKAEGLSEFERWQIVMARRLGSNISEKVWLVGCSCAAVFSIYAKWINNGETRSRHLAVGRPLVIK